MEDSWAIGVDLGGTKLEVGKWTFTASSAEDCGGHRRFPRPRLVKAEVIAAVQDLLGDEISPRPPA